MTTKATKKVAAAPIRGYYEAFFTLGKLRAHSMTLKGRSLCGAQLNADSMKFLTVEKLLPVAEYEVCAKCKVAAEAAGIGLVNLPATR